MNRRTVATVVAVVLAVAASVVGVRVVDPLASGPGAPSVDQGDPPEEVAYAAMRRAETGNFAVSYRRERRFVGPNGTDEEVRRYRARYDNADDQVRYDAAADGSRRFENPYFVWTAVGDDVRRRENVDGIAGRFYGEERVLGCDCVTLRRENDTAVVLRIDDPILVGRLRFGPEVAVDSIRAATLTLVVDGTDWHLRRASVRIVLESSRADVDRVVVRHEEWYSGWGDVSVERPPWAGYTVGEFLHDLANVERKR